MSTLVRFSLACLILFIISSTAFAQYKTDWRSDIDFIIQESDSLSLKSQKTFSLLKPYHRDKDIRETWYYTVKDGRVIIFEIQYVLDSMEFTEIYYMHRGRLICMEQYEAPYLSVYTDQLKSGEAFFFLDETLKQYVMTGKRRPAPGLWNSETASLSKFNQRFAELQRHIKYMR
ncbi:MAG TPA: hypothetical protein VGD17_02495 [Chitinophagaceae bacterium]